MCIFGDPGEEPMRQLVEELTRREYADQLHAFTSLTSFNLTSAPNYEESLRAHDVIGMVYHPAFGLFGVEYCEWESPTRNPPRRTVARRECEPTEVGGVIDSFVLRLLMERKPRDSGRA
jgi:hypothetical protein